MLRPAGADALNALRAAARSSDADLDWALLRVGILAPAELGEIRELLSAPDANLRAGTNREGHRVLAVLRHGEPLAAIHHDGRVTVTAPA